MKSLRKYLWFHTDNRIEFINITNKVRDVVKKSGLHNDYKKWLEEIFYGEFDGKRDKRVLVKVIGE